MSILPALFIALLAPVDSLSRFPVANYFVLLAREIVPGITRLAAVSSFPNVTELVVATVWAMAPVQVVLFFYQNTFELDLNRIRAQRRFLSLCLALSLLGVVGLFSLHDIGPHDLQGNMTNEIVLRMVSTSRVWLGFWVGLFGIYAAGTISILVFFMRHFSAIYLNRDPSR